jgi:hypothetical protein
LASGVVAVGLLLLTWVSLPLTPVPGFDPSWQAALHMGANGTYAWGRDIIWTYGPLGFLKVPTYWYAGTGALAVAYTTVLRLVLLVVLWRSARRSFTGLGAAVLLALVAANLGDPVLPLAFAAACWFLRPGADEQPAALRIGGAAVAGSVTAMELLAKVNTGATLLALGLVALVSIATGRRRRLELAAAYAGSLGATLLALWLVAGQPLGALVDYFRTAASIVSGYGAAMGSGSPALAWQYAAFILTFGAGLAGAVLASAAWPRRARIGLAAAWITLAFFSFKAGFVRHDAAHSALCFWALLGALVAIPWPRRRWYVGLAAIAVPFVTLVHTLHQTPGGLVSVAHVSGAWNDVSSIWSPGDQRAYRELGRMNVMGGDPLDAATLAALQGHSVWVAPTEEAAAWAYKLRWRPLPVFQPYQSDTALLDRENAAALRDARAPERILLRPEPPVDGRVITFDSPAAVTEMLCRYRVEVASGGWFVLARGANRCAAARPLTRARAGLGEPVPIPAARTPGAMVSVRIRGMQVGGLERIRDLLFKPRQRRVRFDEGEWRRLVPGTAGDGLILSVPPAVDLPPPVAANLGAATIAVGIRGAARGSGSVEFAFYETPVAAP